jgi:hypothetical protein
MTARPPLPRNGCYNRAPLVETVIVQTGWSDLFRHESGLDTRVAYMDEIPNPNSKDCQYSRTTEDERCDGCVWKQGM